MLQAVDELERGRCAYEARAWVEAYEALSRADALGPVAADDLELLARSAYMLGRDDDYVSGLERAHDLHFAAGDVPRAVRCAFWVGHNMLFRGRIARARGWFARANRELESEERDCVERGFLLIPVWLEQMAGGDYEAGYGTAGEAAAIGERFGDADLMWLARDEQGRALVKQGRVEEGLRLVDEALLATTAGELSPVVTGIVYCNTIAFCRDAYELRHAREWTEALTTWCGSQPEMVAHNGLCLVHRAEIMQLQGAWDDAVAEARRAAERFTQGALNELACVRHAGTGVRRGAQRRLGLLQEVVSSAPQVDPSELKDRGALPQRAESAVREALALLEQKATPEEVEACRNFLLKVAETVARAHKEGGFLGIGGKEVSESEQAALDEITGRVRA